MIWYNAVVFTPQEGIDMKPMKRAACLVGVALFVLPALADGPYGLVEAVVAAAEIDASYEPFRPDALYRAARSEK
jgi:hypothetical protein